MFERSTIAKLKPKSIRDRVETRSAILRAQNHFSVVFEPSHPLRPVIGQDVARFGPGTPSIEVRMPFQRPQLLDADLAHGPVHEHGIDDPAVTVDTEGPHPVTAYRGPGGGLIFKGRPFSGADRPHSWASPDRSPIHQGRLHPTRSRHPSGSLLFSMYA